ncbi:CBASS cGAMP synthase [Larkinella humicola]|uniref:Cyclic GMP-AMP synthase n=1 Tax=Larkinella humicola TaxID=2607654 RepID=A0A5N1J3M7_9BACT|nr:nucleotidyltransferase [Larkinella humicola]KAA9341142.1 nucleotidyltransferase [Larkinella humicola]
MANCHSLFTSFNSDELKLTATKKDRMCTSREDLRKRIKKHFAEKHPEYKPRFYIQGSYKMGTVIRTEEDTCDMDNGVYFFPKPSETATTMQKWVLEAVEGATSTPPEHKKKCVRVIYKGDYHIDLPVYYRDSSEGDNSPNLAVKGEGWSISDPKKFWEWYQKEKDGKAQVVRLIRYQKAWSDRKRKSIKMPKGVALTVLCVKHRVLDDRDDKAMYYTLKAIRDVLKKSFKCILPVTPGDDLLASFTGKQRDDFLDELDTFIDNAKKAIDETNQLKASNLWRKHLGDRFPLGEDADIDARERALREKASYISAKIAYTTSAGVITDSSINTTRNRDHSFYGE